MGILTKTDIKKPDIDIICNVKRLLRANGTSSKMGDENSTAYHIWNGKSIGMLP